MLSKNKTYQPADETRISELAGVPLASFTQRGLALITDFILAALLFLSFLIGGGLIAQSLGILKLDHSVKLEFTFFKNWFSIVWLVLYFTLSVYFSNGRTIGKKIFKIRIVSLVHEHISLWHSLERALGYGASALEAGFGFIQYFIRADRRTVHDRIAETIVVREITNRD
ncbi:MAG: RDD family protein [Ignavibacteriales bacterium]|nr:RDD family protein [Ignavibacteriales bacterium]